MMQPELNVTGLLLVPLLAFVNPISAADESVAYTESPITATDRQHWSFRPLTPVKVPPAVYSDWGIEFGPRIGRPRDSDGSNC